MNVPECMSQFQALKFLMEGMGGNNEACQFANLAVMKHALNSEFPQ